MASLSGLVLTFLLNAAWQSTLLALVVAMAARLLRRTPAVYRHILWVMGLALALLLPLASVRSRGDFARPLVSVESSAPPESRLSPPMTLPRRPAGGSMVAPSAGTPAWRTLLNRFRRRSRPIIFSPLGADVALGLYLLALLGYLARLARAWNRARQVRLSGRPPLLSPEARALVERCQGTLGLASVTVRASSQVASPATVGAFRPLIILPESLLKGPPSPEFASALCHEMAHVRRRDYLQNLICEFAFLPLVFHPAAWLLRRRISETRELACDEAAGRFLTPVAYARSLVSLAQALAPLGPASRPRYTLGVFDANILEERIMRLLDNRPPVSSHRARCLFGGALVAMALTVVMAGALSLAAVEDTKPAAPAGKSAAFSGHWELDPPQSNLPSPAPENLVEVINLRGSHLKVTTTSADWNSSKPIAVSLFALLIPEFSTTTDGRETVQPFGPGQIRSETHWDGGNLVTDWSLVRNGEVAITGRWVRSLTPDGKTQTVDITAHDPVHNLDGQAKAVFVKRADGPEGGVTGGVAGGVPGGVAGGVPGGVAGGVESGAPGRPPIILAMAGVTGGIVSGGSTRMPARAAEASGTVSGVVFDPSGARVPQASVAITKKETQAKQMAETNETGEFSFASLAPGEYNLTATKVGFGIYAEAVTLTAQNSAAPLNIVLMPGDVLQAIDVTAARAPGKGSAPEASGPQRMRVGGLIQATKLITMQKPDYPESARAQGIQGVVLLQAVISTEGVPLSLKVISSPDPALSEAAQDAVREWRYEPTLLNGEPIEVVTTVAVRFHLQD